MRGSLRRVLLPVGQRAARSLPERWPAVPLAGALRASFRFKAIDARTGEGQPNRCPFKARAKMDAKTHHLALLAALSLVCAMLALAVDHAVFGSVFSALSAVAVIGAAGPRHRW
jgi:hypothetical protein